MEGFSLGNGGDTGISMLNSVTFGALIGTVQKCSHKRDLRASGSTGLSLPQSALLDFYVKNVLMSKVKPQKYLLVSEWWPFLVRLAKSPFKFCDSEPSFILSLLP